MNPALVARVLPLIAVLGPLSCAPPEADPDPRPLSLLFLTVDTLRQDRLSAYGHPGPVSPRLDRFARDATQFEQAYAQAPWTLASYATLMTSRYPSRHGAVWPRHRIPLEELSLAEVLAAAGWETRAYVNNVMLGPGRNLDQGFADYDHAVSKPRDIRSADETAELVVAWLESRPRDTPFFLLVNLMEPHMDYFPSAPVRERFDPGYEGAFREGFPEYKLPTQFLGPDAARAFPDSVRRHARALYDAEVSEADRGCGAILAALERLDLLDATIVVFLSDHGEELWDHGGLGHAQSLYEEQLRVPLLVRVPEAARARWGWPRGALATAPVGLIDVAPTILDILGLEIPPEFDGVSFATPSDERPAVFAEATLHGGELKSITDAGWKLVFDPFLGDRTLHRLSADPAEHTDLAARHPEKTLELLAELVQVGRIPGGGLRVAGRGAGEVTVIRGRVETSGTIVQALPWDLEAFENTRRDRERVRDAWTVDRDASALDFTFRMDSDVDGLTIFVDPPDAETRWDVSIDGEQDPTRIRLGRRGLPPPGIPFAVDSDSVRCPPDEPPREWREGSGPVVAIWSVGGLAPAWNAEEIDLDPETVENLRALGYLE